MCVNSGCQGRANALVLLASLSCWLFGSVGAVMAGDEPSKKYPVIVQHPPGLGMVDTDQVDVNGAVVGVSCATCHGRAARESLAERAGAPADFHRGITLEHGGGRLLCASCHDPEDRTKLRLADGRRLRMDQVMELCAQCHGSQHRDFQHGAHGGSRGYWDLTKGPRFRNSCVACHAAHDPVYPPVRPAPAPNDRFLSKQPPEADDGHAASRSAKDE